MGRKLLVDAFGWGFALWLIGYLLGIVLFFIVPPEILGWVIMPIGAVITSFVLMKKVEAGPISRYAAISIVWTLMAVALDYVFIVMLLNPAGGYYKPDVLAYYALTFIMPLAFGYLKTAGKTKQ